MLSALACMTPLFDMDFDTNLFKTIFLKDLENQHVNDDRVGGEFNCILKKKKKCW